MTEQEMKLLLLRNILGEVAELLESVGEHLWAPRIRQALRESTLDPHEIVQWYGGMGSLNDLIIARANGHQIVAERERGANQRLSELRSEIHSLATGLC
jgi:hypothetical protein